MRQGAGASRQLRKGEAAAGAWCRRPFPEARGSATRLSVRLEHPRTALRKAQAARRRGGPPVLQGVTVQRDRHTCTEVQPRAERQGQAVTGTRESGGTGPR